MRHHVADQGGVMLKVGSGVPENGDSHRKWPTSYSCSVSWEPRGSLMGKVGAQHGLFCDPA